MSKSYLPKAACLCGCYKEICCPILRSKFMKEIQIAQDGLLSLKTHLWLSCWGSHFIRARESPLTAKHLQNQICQRSFVPSNKVCDQTMFGDSIPVASPVLEHLGVLIVGPRPRDRSLWTKYQLHPRAFRVDTPGKVVASQKSFWTASTLSSIPRVIESQQTSLQCQVGLWR